jgi:hypothetical protein
MLQTKTVSPSTELTGGELDAVSGGDANNLAADSILTYCSQRLGGLDATLGENMQKQQGGQSHELLSLLAGGDELRQREASLCREALLDAHSIADCR